MRANCVVDSNGSSDSMCCPVDQFYFVLLYIIFAHVLGLRILART